MRGLLVEKFSRLVTGQEMWPPLYNSAVQVQTSGWNTKKYFAKYYKDKTPFPLLLTVKEDEGVMYFPVTKIKNIARERFRKYWRNPFSFSKLNKEFQRLSNKVDDLYSLLGHEKIKNSSEKALVGYLKTLKNAIWSLNTLVIFSIYFEKEDCAEFLTDNKVDLKNIALDKIWIKAAAPLDYSFDKRRFLNILASLKRGIPTEELSERHQFYTANYNKIANLNETRQSLKQEFSKYMKMSPRQIDRLLIKERQAKILRERKFREWLRTLNSDQEKLVLYIQSIMQFRDRRKDQISKSLVLGFRIAQKFFREAGIEEKYIMYEGLDELEKGTRFLRKLKKDFPKRVKGYTVLIKYNGKKETEFGTYEKTVKTMEGFIYGNRSADSPDYQLIKGQTGSPGKARGKARVIKNINSQAKNFRKGEILVTGMTRPEFVPIMKKSAAVVTDEGGMTSHAAIVCRELGIPCVIGTGVATSMIKSGSYIEVDASKAVVKKI